MFATLIVHYLAWSYLLNAIRTLGGWLGSGWWLFNNHPVCSLAVFVLDALIFGLDGCHPQDVHKLQDVWELKISPIGCFLRCFKGDSCRKLTDGTDTTWISMGPEILSWAFFWDVRTSRFVKLERCLSYYSRYSQVDLCMQFFSSFA